MNLIKCAAHRFAPSKLVMLCSVWAATTAGFAQTQSAGPCKSGPKGHGRMPPTFYGLMTEEINYSYEGGLYGELIRNRAFKAGTNERGVLEPVGGG